MEIMTFSAREIWKQRNATIFREVSSIYGHSIQFHPLWLAPFILVDPENRHSIGLVTRLETSKVSLVQVLPDYVTCLVGVKCPPKGHRVLRILRPKPL